MFRAKCSVAEVASGMLLTHRPIEDRDIPIVCRFPQSEEELFFFFPKAVFPLTPWQLQDSISQRSDSTVVELEGHVVAFANFYRWGAKGCSIGNVIVSPTVRGQGVGSYLVEQMVGLGFSKHGAIEVTVSCFNQNVVGLIFYPKLGFKPYAIDERQDKNGNRVALIHMRRRRNAC